MTGFVYTLVSFKAIVTLIKYEEGCDLSPSYKSLGWHVLGLLLWLVVGFTGCSDYITVKVSFWLIISTIALKTLCCMHCNYYMRIFERAIKVAELMDEDNEESEYGLT